MKSISVRHILLSAGILLILFVNLSIARSLYDISTATTFNSAKVTGNVPYLDYKIHNLNKIGLLINNQGTFGTGFFGDKTDPITGSSDLSDIYPYPGNTKYIFAGGFWIGAVVGRDTLVSVGADGWFLTREMWPDTYPRGEIKEKSINNPDDDDALSEQDIIAVYTDTVVSPNYVESDPFDNRPHIPLNIEITQKSYAWSYEYAEDFILFDYAIKNIGHKVQEQVYMGVYMDAECRRTNGWSPEEYLDDVSGFRRYVNSNFGCGFVDTINLAWVADADGRNNEDDECPGSFQVTSAAGLKIVRTPSDSLNYSYNWWISNPTSDYDFSPRKLHEENGEMKFRDFGGNLGTPNGDRNKYYLLRMEEFDYDQLFAAKDHTLEGWLPPSPYAEDFADGYDTRFLLSFGPFTLVPGEVLPVSFALINGENFHSDCTAFERLFKPTPRHPEQFYNQLDFSDFAKNAIRAEQIYDNPGYDTDGDGDPGDFRTCPFDTVETYDTFWVGDAPPLIDYIDTVETILEDTLWSGDGVPDFRGASPPPAPKLRVEPRISAYNCGELVIRWNGKDSENEKDIFSHIIDFEGYRVKISLTPAIADFTLVSSFDLINYNKYYYNSIRGYWELSDIPFSVDELVDAYGSGVLPYIDDPDAQYRRGDSTFRFEANDWNAADLHDTTLIHKRFPNEPPPTTLDLDSALEYFSDELVDDTLFKYYEYEYVVRNLLPSRHYYVAVTAFDFGSPGSGMAAMESSPKLNMVSAYAQNSNSVVKENELDIVVYPNPYRADGRYRELGFEGMGNENLIDDRARLIHFTNLPNKCTIRIFSIDGDLIREVEHDFPHDHPEAMHETWDVITRNTQPPVSGIYYWVVESAVGTQMGKLVLIM